MEFYSNAGMIAGSFEEIKGFLHDQKYWVRFFAKPCCPSCDEESADRHIRDFSKQIRDCEELSQSQKNELLEIAEQRCAWYKTLPICRH